MSESSCVFCEIAAGRGEASIVHQDENVMAFMDLHPVTRGHLLVVPTAHSVGLEDLGDVIGERVWSLARRLARTMRRSSIPCEGINLLLCDGEVAFQTVFHVHLHVIPRTRDDGWTLPSAPQPQDRAPLDADARSLRAALSPAVPETAF